MYRMYNKIVAIGPVIKANKTSVSGQTMMFQLFIDELKDRSIGCKIINIGNILSSTKKRISGKFSIFRLLEYSIVIFKFFFFIIFNPKEFLYITTAQSKVGFFRDYLIINLAKLFKYKIICHQFGANYSVFFNSQSPRLKRLIKITFTKVHRIIVEGEYTKEQFRFLNDYSVKVISIPNGLPEKNLRLLGSGKRYEIDQIFQLMYLSNMIISKGFWDVLFALDILINKKGLKVECVFAGSFISAVDDPKGSNVKSTEEAFFRYIKNKKLSNNVRYFPFLFDKEKIEAFKLAHVFLLPSYYVNEGQPVSVLEAMAYGVVPIVTKHRLIPSMIKNNSGYFVLPRSPNDISEVIHHLMMNPEIYNRSSQASYELYLESFTSEKYLNAIINLFN
ncbi:MAG: glycosyltransferase family 4 protein [Candidatus Delongbacteria bacterium]|nr:glycosyltransferase family 4 protein [Candidatus Delongbacteria bacterium]